MTAGRLAMLLLATMLGGCGGLLPGAGERPVATYMLAPEFPPPAAAAAAGRVLEVSRPRAAAGYASSRMAYLERDFRLDYFADNAWVEPPGDMLQASLQAALDATGRFRVVDGEASGLDPDLRLDLEILELHQDFRTRPSQAVLVLRARLVDPNARRLLATRRFAGREPASAEEAYGGVVALNRILARLLGEIAAFAVAAAESRPPL